MDLCLTGIDCSNDKHIEKDNLRLISSLLESEISPLVLTYKLNVFETDFPVIKLEFDLE